MTIKFNCPYCNALIAFPDKHAGKRARCQTCQQLFFIPSKDDEKPKKFKTEEIETAEPVPGFYRAVFIDNWKLFIVRENVTSLAFIVAAICFNFFLARAICCVNYITFAVVWGWLLGFYLNIIYETAFEIDILPQIYFGEGIAFFFNIIKPFLIFSSTMAVAQAPFIIAWMLLKDKGITTENMWQAEFGLRLLLQVLFILGLFLFPMAILTTAVGKDLTILLRPDYIVLTILRAFGPYLIIVALLAAACILQMQTSQYQAHIPIVTNAARLTLNLAVQVIAIIAMRAIGLFYRHYSCHLPW
jgi:hypothetical protein